MSIESMMLFNHLILCHPLLPSIFPSIRVFPMSQLFASGGQSVGALASVPVFPMNIQGWFPSGLTGSIFQSKGLSRVFSSTTIWKHQFFSAQPSLGFPGGSEGQESASGVRRPGLGPCVRKIPWRREWLPTPVFLPGEFHGQRNLVGYSPWGGKESESLLYGSSLTSVGDYWKNYSFDYTNLCRQIDVSAF